MGHAGQWGGQHKEAACLLLFQPWLLPLRAPHHGAMGRARPDAPGRRLAFPGVMHEWGGCLHVGLCM
jgi:hypothetical protein